MRWLLPVLQRLSSEALHVMRAGCQDSKASRDVSSWNKAMVLEEGDHRPHEGWSADHMQVSRAVQVCWRAATPFAFLPSEASTSDVS